MKRDWLIDAEPHDDRGPTVTVSFQNQANISAFLTISAKEAEAMAREILRQVKFSIAIRACKDRKKRSRLVDKWLCPNGKPKVKS